MYAILDCCYSGTALDLPYSYMLDSNKEIIKTINGKALPKKRNFNGKTKYTIFGGTRKIKQKPKPNPQSTSVSIPQQKGQIVMISGCRDDQTSQESYDQNKIVGALTTSFITIMKENKNNITYRKLIEELRIKLKEKGYSQVPQLSSNCELNLDDRLIV